MPKINVKATRLVFNRKKYERAVAGALEEVFKEAVKAFLRATVQHVPVDTGMSAGSFLNIGYYYNAGLPAIIPKRYNVLYEEGGYKSIERGAELTTPPEEVLTPKTFLLGKGINFTLETKVWQYKFHEPTWMSFAAGMAAFNAVLDKTAERIPTAEKFMVKETMTLNGTKLYTTKRKLTS